MRWLSCVVSMVLANGIDYQWKGKYSDVQVGAIAIMRAGGWECQAQTIVADSFECWMWLMKQTGSAWPSKSARRSLQRSVALGVKPPERLLWCTRCYTVWTMDRNRSRKCSPIGSGQKHHHPIYPVRKAKPEFISKSNILIQLIALKCLMHIFLSILTRFEPTDQWVLIATNTDRMKRWVTFCRRISCSSQLEF